MIDDVTEKNLALEVGAFRPFSASIAFSKRFTFGDAPEKAAGRSGTVKVFGTNSLAGEESEEALVTAGKTRGVLAPPVRLNTRSGAERSPLVCSPRSVVANMERRRSIREAASSALETPEAMEWRAEAFGAAASGPAFCAEARLARMSGMEGEGPGKMAEVSARAPSVNEQRETESDMREIRSGGSAELDGNACVRRKCRGPTFPAPS